jgi:pimeloyl-ACP methyl ester carboxylesterase
MEDMINKILDKMILNPETSAIGEELMQNYNIISQLNEIEVPTLILVGADDFITPPSQAKRIHDGIPNSELHIFKRCGHYPFYEVPNEFHRVVRKWFRKVYKK